MRIILASASPRRADLLRAAGYSFDVRALDVDERVLEGEQPRAYVERLAIEKARHALQDESERTPSSPSDVLVVGADTAVVVDGQILGKPANLTDAERMLRLLSARAHVVLTGVCVQTAWGRVAGVDETRVFFAPLTDEQVAWYLESGEGLDKAGGYGIQGLASRFVPRIDGSYSNVVGLPLALVDALIREVTGGPHVLASAR